jgi:prevent-host-death family protein
MNVALSDAKAQLSELVRLAEQGEEVMLTRHGDPKVRLTAVRRGLPKGQRLARIEAIMAEAERQGITSDIDAAQSQDFLYGWDGLPV